jgi:hypothetical protein
MTLIQWCFVSSMKLNLNKPTTVSFTPETVFILSTYYVTIWYYASSVLKISVFYWAANFIFTCIMTTHFKMLGFICKNLIRYFTSFSSLDSRLVLCWCPRSVKSGIWVLSGTLLYLLTRLNWKKLKTVASVCYPRFAMTFTTTIVGVFYVD